MKLMTCLSNWIQPDLMKVVAEILRRNKAQYHESCCIMFNNMKLERARTKKRKAEGAQPVECKAKLRRTSIKSKKCFLCDKEFTSSKDKRVNKCAQTLNDGKLLARLSAGDNVAQELKCHPACLAHLYNRERSYLRAKKRLEKEDTTEGEVYPQAISELHN